MADVQYDIVILGGSLGGVSAALSAASASADARICLLVADSWLGGQFTAQGVTRPDENQYIETVGSTASYRSFRHNVRAFYRDSYTLSAAGTAQPLLDPGGPYPGFSMEPLVGHKILSQMLAALPNVTVQFNVSVTGVEVDGDTIASVTAVDESGSATSYLASYFLDATDLGDLLPLCGDQGADWVLGAESEADTGEPAAPPDVHPEWVQPITVPIALERRPAGEDNRIAQPAGYAAMKAAQNYALNDGYISTMFVAGKDMWSYREFIAAANFADPAFPCDLSMMNCGSNDYLGGTIPTGDAASDAAVVEQARQVTLGFLYWLQTECPRDDGSGQGYPELKARPDMFGTTDGTAAQPYIRESRRILAVGRVVQQDIDAQFNTTRARLFADSCGIGFYGMDVHGLPIVNMPELFLDTVPYQISLSTLIPVRLTNLLASCKNTGVSHIASGAYRLHPIEWNIGESAGALAAFCLSNQQPPAAVPSTPALLRAYQHVLLAAGVPLFWWTDVTADMPCFAAVQLLGVNRIVSGEDDMTFHPDDALTAQDKSDIEGAVGQTLDWPTGEMTRGDAAIWLAQELGL